MRAEYLEALIKFCGNHFEKAFLLSAGTEATEAAFKLMRMYGEKQNKRKRGIISIENNWHGRTLGAQMMSSNLDQKAWVGDLDEYIQYPVSYPWAIGDQNPVVFFQNPLRLLVKLGLIHQLISAV